MDTIAVVLFFYGMAAIFGLAILYFIIKWAVKNGVKEAYLDIKEMNRLNEVNKIAD